MEKKQKKVSMFDPTRNAFCAISIELAKKFIESAKEAEKRLIKLEKND